jgi:hypothetical protein
VSVALVSNAHFIYFLSGDEDDPDKPVPDVMRLPKEGKLLNVNGLFCTFAVVF